MIARAADKSSRRRGYAWTDWPKERLLAARIADLDLRIAGSALASGIEQLYHELAGRGFTYFRPHCWLSDEWFCPDGVPGIAAPFFLAHPRLKRLEKEFMLEVEGGTRESCLKLLRHETGHALANAYRVHHRRGWRQHFGKSTARYPDMYLPRPYSKRFVIHLENWYAQSHPHEDWAETFAVWLKPRSDWRRRYQDWPALKKLEFVDRLMQEIKGERPLVTNRRVVAPVESLRMTLSEYYRRKQAHYAHDHAEFYDRDLRRLFAVNDGQHRHERASHYLRRVQRGIIAIVARWTGEYHYRINAVVKDMIHRCDELDLRVVRSDEEMQTDLIACLTMIIVHHMRSGGFHVSL